MRGEREQPSRAAPMCRRCRGSDPPPSTMSSSPSSRLAISEPHPHFAPPSPATPFTHHHHSRASSNSRTAVFQTDNEGATPSARSAQPPTADAHVTSAHEELRPSSSRFSGEDRRLQHGARGFNSLSALPRRSGSNASSTEHGSRRVGHPGLSDKEPALRSIRR